MNFKNIPNWRSLAICAVFLAINSPNSAYAKSNFLGKTLEIKYTYKCKGYSKHTENITSIVRVLGNGIILYEWVSGKNVGIDFKLNSTIRTKYTHKLSWKINGKIIRKTTNAPVVATAKQQGNLLKLSYSRNVRYTSPNSNKVYEHLKSNVSVNINKDKCGAFSANAVGWGRVNGGKKHLLTCKSSKARCKMK